MLRLMTTQPQGRRALQSRLTHPVAAIAAVLAMAGVATPTADAGQQACLRQTADGWTLVSPDGAVLFEATGPDARDRCLRWALDSGVLQIVA
jgi:hypothetical protein